MRMVFIFAFCLSCWAQDYHYYGQDVSLVEWSQLDHRQWLDYQLWKDHSVIKDHYPKWRQNLRDTRLSELMGRVLECVGECRIYRGEGYAKASFRSTIREGDEVVTERESYLWIFLYDGTMVRMAPGSSISFRELNVGKSKNFLHARINSGNVLWLSRDSFEVPEQKLRETDTLFIPLDFYQANSVRMELNEENLYSYVDRTSIERALNYKRLNRLIVKNNNHVEDKRTEHFLVMPNGTLFGENVRVEFVVLTGGESYIKNRSHPKISEEVLFFYRGYANKEQFSIVDDTWYQISRDGRTISELDSNDTRFGIGEYLTKRIPTILTARELLLERYALFIFNNAISAKDLAEKHGYRQWKDDDHQQRVNFLKEYTRRIETTNLLVSRQLQKRLEKMGDTIHGMYYTPDVYRRALNNYIIKQEISERADSDQEVLNSTSRKLWKRINANK